MATIKNTTTAHVIYLFATTNYPTTLFMSQDTGDTWTVLKDFTTIVSAGDTVQWKLDLQIGTIPNDISEIINIQPANFFVASEKPGSNNEWTGKIKNNNPQWGQEIYKITYKVNSGSGAIISDPIIRMKN